MSVSEPSRVYVLIYDGSRWCGVRSNVKPSRTARILQLLNHLGAGQASASSLATALGVTRRTIFRDIRHLADAGWPIEFDRSTQSYQLPDRTIPWLNSLAGPEILASLVALSFVESLRLWPDEEAVEQARAKLRAAMPVGERSWCDQILQCINVDCMGRSAATGLASILHQVIQALRSGHALEIQIDRDNGSRNAVVHPYGLRHSDRGWSVAVYDESAQSLQLLRLEHIIQARQATQVTDATYSHMGKRLAEEGQAAQASDSPCRVLLHFAAEVAMRVEETEWFPGQACDCMEDGTLLFGAEVHSLDEIVPWLLGWGRHVQVLGPPALVECLACELRAMQHNHLEAHGRQTAMADRRGHESAA
jgi:predicted DNA-binding transcriptional regulator YafY